MRPVDVPVYAALWRTVWQLRTVVVWKSSDKIWKKRQQSFNVLRNVKFI